MTAIPGRPLSFYLIFFIISLLSFPLLSWLCSPQVPIRRYSDPPVQEALERKVHTGYYCAISMASRLRTKHQETRYLLSAKRSTLQAPWEWRMPALAQRPAVRSMELDSANVNNARPNSVKRLGTCKGPDKHGSYDLNVGLAHAAAKSGGTCVQRARHYDCVIGRVHSHSY
ncbi:hypothetical protein BDV38DRAFT_239703 [Aspergillus pseudotamarii]|uniref:Uncharacterized protein n=1 Tax=Aspergillus pseudotamarii TaxID=132259 RepID=A0A5N6T2B5_ASPPS|nr:uncharacterized protein BDV38DRAFT_239703 [Aspergillus pseudotamarii]KAE8140435.1 hypothetical protein BDV38DRAFT_239703 [Aspergillus pseudotamarii]